MTPNLSCIVCASVFDLGMVRYTCDCGGLLELTHPLETFKLVSKDTLNKRRLSRKKHDISGVWRFREVVLPLHENAIVSHPEGGTHLYDHPKLASFAGVDRLQLKHEGENPTGSFKDRGMTVAVSKAVELGMSTIACASTGNTSASLAAYAAQAGKKALVFLPEGKVASGKLAQTVGYGATCVAIKGDFDDAMKMVRELSLRHGVYLVNSVNPFRLEGQKTIMWEMLHDRDFVAPDWVVVPGGNLGNTSAFGKALDEAYRAGWIAKLPRLAVIQAEGASPFHKAFDRQFDRLVPMQAETVATAIRIGNPVNYSKAEREIKRTRGLVISVSDADILAAKKIIDGVGIGCEPASACSLAGIRALTASGHIKADDDVVGVLTGHMLKDSDVIMQQTGTKIHTATADVKSVMRFL